MSVVTIGPGNGSTDVAAQINAALADPSVTKVVLEAGTYLLHSPIFVPSNKTLEGAGRELTVLKAAPDFARGPGEGEGVVNSVRGAENIALSDFAIDGDSLLPGGFRLHGCFMREVDGFSISRVDVHNITGYAHFAQGDANTMSRYTSGSYEDCLTTNSQIHYEQMFADGITLTNCHAREGAGTLNGTFFHPVLGSRNIFYIDCTAYGAASAGVEITADWILPVENIQFINTSVEVTLGNPAFVAAGSSAITGLVITGSSFISHHQVAMMLHQTTGTITDTYIQGEAIALNVWNGSSTSTVTVTDSHIVALRDPVYNVAAYGFGGDGAVTVIGGLIDARAGLGPAYSKGTTTVTISPTTALQVGGYDAISTYVENADAAPAAPLLTFKGLLPDQGGHVLTVSLLTAMASTDRLDIAGAGDGPGQISLSNGELRFEGVVVGTVAGGSGTAPLVISFNAAATAQAVTAAARAVTYRSLSEDLGGDSRILGFRVEDAAGAYKAQALTAVKLTAVDDPGSLSLAGAAAEAVENGGAVPVAPGALLSDIDGSRIDGGTVTVGFGSAADAGDLLGLAHQGYAAGQIGVYENFVTYGGALIGTRSGGANGTPLVIALEPSASLAAVQALLRAVTFASSADAPPQAARSLSFTLLEGGGGVFEASASVVVQPTDDPSLAQADVAGSGEDAPTAIDAAANDDPDGFGAVIVTIEGQAVAPGDSVILASGAKVILNQDGTLSYDPNGAFEALAGGATAQDSFGYGLAEGGLATVSVTVTGINDAPLIDLALPSGPLAFVENGDPLILAADALASDVDSADFAGGSLTVAFADDTAHGGDRLSLVASGDLQLDDGALLWMGAPTGTVSGGSGGAPLVVAFGPGASAAAVQAVLRAVAYHSLTDAPDPAPRALTFTLADGDGGSRSAQVSLAITPVDDPAAAQADSAAVGEDAASTLDVGGNDDVDGPAPAIASVNGAALATGQWTALASGARVQLTAEGKLIYDPNGAFDALKAGETGSDSFTYALAEGGSAQVTLAIAGVDDPLAPADDAGTTGEGAAVTVDVLANDVDPDGGARQVVEIAGQAVLPGGTVELPSGALVTLKPDGTLAYDPNGAFGHLVDPGSGAANGSTIDSFTYTVLGGGTAVARVTVTGETGPGDTFDGSAGDDSIAGSAEADSFRMEQGGEDQAAGGEGADLLYLGTALSDGDRFDGGDGADALLLQGDQSGRLRAGQLSGIETLALLSAADGRFGGGGGDGAFQYSLASDDAALGSGAVLTVDGSALAADETLAFDGSAETDASFLFLGGAGNDDLTGGALADRLDGGAGADRLAGGKGDDLYLLDDLGDVAVEAAGEGVDEVRTAIGSRTDFAAMYVLAANIENFTGLSATGQGVYGNALDNVITMGAGGDLLALGDGGKDTVSGGGGDDFVYFAGAFDGEDRVDGGAGFDGVGLLGTYDLTLGAQSLVSIEKLSLFGSGEPLAPNSYAITTVDANVGTGAQLMVVAMSLASGETLAFNGSAESNGSFHVRGGKGDDTITGGAKNDQIYGNLGADILTGGAGADVFEYLSAAESTAGARDTIVGFATGDRINLVGIDAMENKAGNNGFSFIGGKAFSGTAGELRVSAAEGGGWLVEGDTNGDGTADLSILVHTAAGYALGAKDFWF